VGAGRPAGEYFGVDATNREVTFRVFSKAVIADGRMIEQGDLVNPLRMQPTSRRHGRFALLEQIHDGVLVLDRDRRVLEINSVAAEILAVDDNDTVNEPVQKLIDDEVDIPEVGSSTEVAFGAGQHIEVSTSSLTDLRDIGSAHRIF
jgi:PAS domain-containing protein